ncbi:UNVERIFIED_CONTAM: hypothetical protein Slati_0852000 [Sesamum latifolium]|uniref:Reverse transcriptase n=1 Tax=Sesamum latifolium TaxID=2727402 RepID=A0AAW2XLX7_9LAMI
MCECWLDAVIFGRLGLRPLVNCSDHKALLLRLMDSQDTRVAGQIEACQSSLSQWSKSVFQAQKKRGQVPKEKMERLLGKQITPEVTAKIDLVRKEPESYADYEEPVSRLRSKEMWLREGDRNIGWPLAENIAKGTEHLHRVVDASMVEDMLQPYTVLKVSKALFQMGPQKSPGPDETKGGLGWMALKLDVSKVYDKVEWSFLEQRPLAPFLTMLNALDSFEASLECVSTVKGVLDIYRRAWGQEINFSKSSVAFSRNTSKALCLSIAAELSILKENKMELYLALPSRVARSKGELFGTAIPSYAMGCFKLPVSLLKEVQRWRQRVGLGELIHAWFDPWLPRPRFFKPITPRPALGGELLVYELLDPVWGSGTLEGFGNYSDRKIAILSLVFLSVVQGRRMLGVALFQERHVFSS